MLQSLNVPSDGERISRSLKSAPVDRESLARNRKTISRARDSKGTLIFDSRHPHACARPRSGERRAVMKVAPLLFRADFIAILLPASIISARNIRAVPDSPMFIIPVAICCSNKQIKFKPIKFKFKFNSSIYEISTRDRNCSATRTLRQKQMAYL